MKVNVRVWLENEEGTYVIGDGSFKLLKEIEQTGSLKEAAENLGMSYRYAWGKIKKMEDRLGICIMNSQKGGKDGGGCSTLTDEMVEFVSNYEKMRNDVGEYATRKLGRLKLRQ